ncbi:hypothetical protein Asp14428_45010 [Actinoplanes sp. NBRC 14428]|nr:hypothetical protein Asp14428_45010 [Actinoplanes sp. NBRC 14428]
MGLPCLAHSASVRLRVAAHDGERLARSELRAQVRLDLVDPLVGQGTFACPMNAFSSPDSESTSRIWCSARRHFSSPKESASVGREAISLRDWVEGVTAG